MPPDCHDGPTKPLWRSPGGQSRTLDPHGTDFALEHQSLNKPFRFSLSCLVIGLALVTSTAAAAEILEAPFPIKAQDAFIDVTVGHAAPYIIDFDGDGLRDLLVGEFGRGSFPISRLPEDPELRKMGFANSKLRIYRNIGTNHAPKYGKYEYLAAGSEHASIPST